MKKSSPNGSAYGDAYFKRIFVKNVYAWQQSTINIWSNTELKGNAMLTAPKVRIANENVSSTGFLLDIDESNPNVLTLNQYNGANTISTGILYDTTFNKPEEQHAFLYASPIFTLPDQQTEAGVYLRNNPTHMLTLTSDTNITFEFPSLPTSIKEDYRQVRITNYGNYAITVSYSGEDIVELFQERVSFIWKNMNGRYTWVYCP
jgi:hypothetical protein